MSEAADLPPVSTELAVVRIIVEAHLRSMKPAHRLRFQKAVAEVLAEENPHVFRMRPVSEHAQIAAARAFADAWIRRMLVHLIGKV